MTIKNIDALYYLFAIIPIFALLYFFYKPDTFRKKATFFTRLGVILLVLLSFMGIGLSIEAKYTGTIFVADKSKSVEKSIKNINYFMRDSLKENVDASDLYGIVSFNEYASVDKPLSENHNFYGISHDFSGGDFTNIENALDRAEFLFPQDMKKRIVLITDGRENIGDLKKKARQLKNQNIGLDLYKVGAEFFPEVEIDSIVLPKTAKKGQNIALEVRINSNVETVSKLYLYNRDDLIEKKDVQIKKGENAFVFSSMINSGGIVEYRAEIVPENDSYLENNKLSTFIDVDDKLKILIVQNNNSGANFAEIFSDFDVDIVDSISAPTKIESLIKYDAYIMADVSLERLPSEFIEQVENLVKEQGKALIVSGGHNSYALGGYHETKLEKMLPLNMDIKDKEENENLAMVLVIDKSGSMSSGSYGLSKMELAIEAAIRSTEVIDDKDYLGVIAFDGASKWVLELDKITDKEAAQSRIGTIRASGGTSIQPALKDAIDALEKNDASYKHIILLTDGQAESQGYGEYINRLQRGKITLSTVAVGKSSDKTLLMRLANAGGGRYYFSDIFTDIPTIFAKESVLAGKKYLNNIEFFPKLKSASPVFTDINALPKLYGYVATSPKPLAKVLLTGVDDDPILATYNYGLGKTASFTSDMHGIWSSEWLAWSENQKLWRNLMGELLSKKLGENYNLSCEYKDGMAVLSLEIEDVSAIKSKSIKGYITSKDGEKSEVDLKLIEPGLYKASIKPSSEGLYLASFNLSSDESKNDISFATAFIVPYSEEFRFFGKNPLDFDEIAAISGGRVITDPSEVFIGKLPKVSSDYDLSKLFLVLALILFLIELVFRMTNLRVNLIKKKKKTIEKETKDLAQEPVNEPETKKESKKLITNKKLNKKKEQRAKEAEKRSSYLDDLLGK